MPHRCLLMLFMLALALLLGSLRLSQATTYYVAQSSGNDTNAGTLAAPFLTIQKCATVAMAGDTCLIRAGIYRETVTPAQSGTAAARITFASYQAEVATVNAADVVTGWTLYSGAIYRASAVGWTLGAGKNQIFLDGNMLVEARWPNVSGNVSHPVWAVSEDGGITGSTAFLTDSDLTFANGFWVGGIAVVNSENGRMERAVITASSSGSVTFGYGSPPDNEWAAATPNRRYYLVGVLGALDSAGEAFLDGSGVYVWVPNSTNPSSHVVEVKRRPYVFDLSNRAYITLQGLTLFGGGIQMTMASNHNVLDGIHAFYTSHFYGGDSDPITNVTPDTGIHLFGSDNTLKNCDVTWAAGPGVGLLGYRHTVTNCTFHDVDYAGSGGAGIHGYNRYDCCNTEIVSGAGQDVISYNTVYNTGGMGIQHMYLAGEKILHNLVYNVGIQNADAGSACTYTWGTNGGNTEIAYNICHDSNGFGERDAIYLDDDSPGFLIHHNVVYNYGGVGIYLKAGNNHVFNNTVWNTGSGIYGFGSPDVLIYNNLTDQPINVGTDVQNNPAIANPLFVNLGAGNFQLQSGSQAINAGRVIPGITDGYVGGAPDVGAFEFGNPAWTAGAGGVPAPTNLRMISVTNP